MHAVPPAQSRTAVASEGRRNRYHHGDLKRALKKAALELIEAEGANGWSLREAARRAGVSHPAAYRHFADKDALVASLTRDGFERLRETMSQHAEGIEDPIARVLALGTGYVRFALEHTAPFRLMFSGGGPGSVFTDEVARADDAAFFLLVETIESAQKQGRVRSGDARAMAVIAWSMVHGLVMAMIDGALERRGLTQLPIADLFYGAATQALGAGEFRWEDYPELGRFQTADANAG